MERQEYGGRLYINGEGISPNHVKLMLQKAMGGIPQHSFLIWQDMDVSIDPNDEFDDKIVNGPNKDRFLFFPVTLYAAADATKVTCEDFLIRLEEMIDIFVRAGAEVVAATEFEDQLRNKGWHYKI